MNSLRSSVSAVSWYDLSSRNYGISGGIGRETLTRYTCTKTSVKVPPCSTQLYLKSVRSSGRQDRPATLTLSMLIRIE